MKPDIYTASYRRVNVRGGKIYLPILVFVGGKVQTILRGTFKTASEAQKRSERFIETWKRWHRIWQSIPAQETTE